MQLDSKQKHDLVQIELTTEYQSRDLKDQNRIKTLKIKQKDLKDKDIQIIQKFNPFRIPPNINDCLFHRAATQFGVPLQRNLSVYSSLNQSSTPHNNKTKSPQPSFQHQSPSNQSQNPSQKPMFIDKKVCGCCGEEPKQKLAACCRIEDIYKVNESLGFYFTYIKAMFLMLFLITISVGSYSLKELITNCEYEKNCIKVYGIPVSKFHVFFNELTVILICGVILFMYIITAYLYYTNAHQHRKIFLDFRKPSNYSVLISNVDHEKVTGKAILEYFKTYDIVDILYTHKIQKYVKRMAKRSLLIAKKQLYESKGADQKVAKLQMKIDAINQYLFNIKKTLTANVEKTVRTDKIILTFKTLEEKIRFQKNYRANIFQVINHTFCNGSIIEINGNKMYAQTLGQPHQVIWQNFEIRSGQRLLRVIMGSLLTLIVLGGSYLFAALVTTIELDNSGPTDGFLSLLFSVGIQIVNFILSLIIEQLTEWEKRYSLTSKFRANLIKNFVSYFLNTTIMPFTLFLFAWGTTHEDALVKNIFTLFIVTNFRLPVIGNFLKPTIFAKVFMRWLIKRQGDECLQTQISSNKYYEKHDFELNVKYGLVIETVTNSIFYAAVFPVGMVISMGGLVLAYWSSKTFLVNFCSTPKLSYRLGRLNDITVFFPTILSLGYAFNSIMIPGQDQFDRAIPFVIGGLTIPIGIVFLIFGNKTAQRIVERQYRGIKQGIEKYKDIRESIQVERESDVQVKDYRELNPTTYIHADVHDHIRESEFGDMNSHLEVYAKDKELNLVRRNSKLNQKGISRQF